MSTHLWTLTHSYAEKRSKCKHMPLDVYKSKGTATPYANTFKWPPLLGLAPRRHILGLIQMLSSHCCNVLFSTHAHTRILTWSRICSHTHVFACVCVENVSRLLTTHFSFRPENKSNAPLSHELCHSVSLFRNVRFDLLLSII